LLKVLKIVTKGRRFAGAGASGLGDQVLKGGCWEFEETGMELIEIKEEDTADMRGLSCFKSF